MSAATARELYDQLFGQQTRPVDRAKIIQQALDAAVAEERARIEQWAMDRIGATQSRGYEYNAGWNQAMATLVDHLRAPEGER